jgi:amino acid transporter
MVPYLFVFASLIRLQREPALPDTIKVPGGKPVARLAAAIGFATATLAILLSLVPPPEEPHKFLAATKVVGASLVLMAVGLIIFWIGKSKHRENLRP